MSIKMFSANSIYNFSSSRSTCSFPLLLPLKTNGGSLFIPNSRNQFKKSVCCSKESEFDFNAYWLGKINSVNKALEATVSLKEPLKLHEAMRYSLLNDGNRVLPLLCIACCELVGGTESTVMPIACAMEMINVPWLMSDDLPCMDNHDFRAGKPTNHKVFGESITLLACYSLFALAFEKFATATKLGVSSTNTVIMLSELARSMLGAEGLSGGQAIELDLYTKDKSVVRIEQVESVYLQKTSIGFEACAVAGAIVGGASEAEINRLRKYCKYTGLVYQIKDDILDHEEDLVAGRASYTALIGKEKSLELIEKLIKKAEDELVGFDSEKAKPLKALLYYIANRKD
uniref:Geranylgeranyl diphosphate synthase IDS6 n=1 Tax=Catharanthus roseus TaxID=4058 RepID=M9R2W2_CATRO|nr:geranylgeranyl diphosphate synthase IDS6 [Catharanthus roseus]